MSNIASDTQAAPLNISNESNVAQLNTLKPGSLQVINREGKLKPFNPSKITVAITKAFLAVQGDTAAASSSVHEIVAALTEEVMETLQRRYAVNGGAVHIEEIQDKVELILMGHGHLEVARAYILYRNERKKLRAKAHGTHDNDTGIHFTLATGKRIPLKRQWLQDRFTEACEGFEDVKAEDLIDDTLRSLYDGVPLSDLRKAMVMTARTRIEAEPNYSFVASQLLINELWQEALDFLALPVPEDTKEKVSAYPMAFLRYIPKAIELELLNPELKTFDLDRLAKAIKPERDRQFTYLSVQTLYDRYFIHKDDIRFELPQVFFMRVAMGLALQEKDKNDKAIEFYNLISSFDFMSSTPTLFNSGTLKSQLSSCYLTTIPDDLAGIYDGIKKNALLQKFAGGLGNDWTPVRAMNAYIKGTNGKSQGVVPFMKVANDTGVAVNQGGKRKGAVCGYLETWHLDIEEFLDLRKNTGDDRRRTHDMNTANWIPDLFMKRLMANEDWTLFSPNDTPDLHELYGKAFEEAYIAYEKQAAAGVIANHKTIPAVNLWRKMISMLFETGHPWITFKDPCNLRSPQQHAGVVHSSNLCTEITLNTSDDEIAVCNLGSVNLANHLDENGLMLEKLEKTIQTAIRMLDNVIDINFYSVIEARRSNLAHRPIGMGMMGFQDALHELKIPYASEDAVEFADRSMEAISYYAIKASTNLAEERGVYKSYEGSLWSQGILPIDSIQLLHDNRDQYLDQNTETTLDWDSLRQRVKTVGMRNSNVLAIAPTATISNICGVSASIEPTYQNLFVKSNLSGEFTVVNPHLVKELKALDIWDAAMVNDLKYYNGSLQSIDRVPEELKALYATAFEVDPLWLVEAASRRQKWIDQAQSLNLYIAKPSGKVMDNLYRTAWMKGLKTTYYCRSLGATNVEKSTISDGALNAVRSHNQVVLSQGGADVECEACQ